MWKKWCNGVHNKESIQMSPDSEWGFGSGNETSVYQVCVCVGLGRGERKNLRVFKPGNKSPHCTASDKLIPPPTHLHHHTPLAPVKSISSLEVHPIYPIHLLNNCFNNVCIFSLFVWWFIEFSCMGLAVSGSPTSPCCFFTCCFCFSLLLLVVLEGQCFLGLAVSGRPAFPLPQRMVSCGGG